MTIEQWLQEAAKQLPDSTSPQLDTYLLTMHVLNKSKTWLIAHGSDVLEKKQLSQLEDLLKKRRDQIPIAYLTGHKEFYGRDFHVTSDVLVPRPETEDVVELAKCHVPEKTGSFTKKETNSPPVRLLDVGTGSGCLGLTLALETGAMVTLSDISEQALAVARKNAKRHEVKMVQFVKSNLLEHWLSHEKPKPFDIIVANLPYVDRTWTDTSPELAHEPDVALYANDHGLELIKTLIDQSPSLLAPGGHLLLEADPSQHNEIAAYAKRFSHIETLGYAMCLQRTAY